MLPCSEVHWKILPSVCSQLALCMEKEGVPRSAIASALGTSEAAVSQYISGKRGAGKLSARAKNECCALAKKFAAGKVKTGDMDIGISMIVVIAKGSTLGRRDPCAICMTAKRKKRLILMALLSLKNLQISAGDKEIIQGISLEVGEGEVHVIMGQNGSGKSTLLSALAGNPKYAVKGAALFEGKDLLAQKTHERARRGMFLAFQSPIEVPGVSLASMLRRAYAARFGDEMSAVEFDKILSAKAEAMGLTRSFFSRGINDGMSGGERKMSEILQLSVLEPRLAMLDEPDSGLDVDALGRVGAAIGKIRKNGMSMVIVTHYARVLRSIKADKVHVMHMGGIVASGDEKLAHKIEEKGYRWVLQ